MKLRVIAILITLLSIAIYYSCQKSGISGGGNNQPQNVTAGISGRILDENNMPVQGAVVKAGSATVNTDINGGFTINNVSLDKNAGFIKVEKEGYFLGSRTIIVSENAVNYVAIQLIKKTVAGNFNAGSGGLVTVPTGGSISFQASAVVNAATQAAYTGTVNVNAFFINPAAANFRDIMPGALRGITTNNEERSLQSFGMMAVELNGAAGEKLQLATSKTATITFPIAAGLQASAPASIPLWSFDEATGLWKQEGTATKQGANYVGTVTHFSFWNCDVPFANADFSVTLKDQNGNPLPNFKVVLIKNSTSDTVAQQEGIGYTDINGKTMGKIPANTQLNMKVYNKCGTLVHTQTAGPFGEGETASLGVITITVPTSQTLVISGTVVNCTAGTVTNGFVDVQLDGSNYRTSVTNSGSFSISITRCSNTAATAKLIVTDVTGGQQGSPVLLNVTGSAANAGQLTACGVTTTQFVNISVNNVNYNIAPPDSLYSVRYNDLITNISAYRTAQNDYRSFYLGFNGSAAPGTVPVNYVDIFVNNKSYIKNGALNVNITEYGQPGEYIAGNFAGTLRDSTNASQTAPVSVSFRVRRQQ